MGKVIAHIVAAEREHGHRVTAKFADVAGGGRGCFAAHGRAQKRSVLPAERLSHQRDNASPAATEKDGVDRHAVWVLPLRGNDRALACRSGEAGIGMSCFARRSRSPRTTQPVDQFRRFFRRHPFPPYVAVGSHRTVGEDGILRGGEHRIPVRLHARSGSHAEESILGIDRIEAAIGAELHPSDIVADGFDFPPRYSRDHHRQVRLAAG